VLRPREVAALFGVRPSTIARWAREGKLTPLLTPGAIGATVPPRSAKCSTAPNCPQESPPKISSWPKTPRDRAIVVVRYWEDLSVRAVADLLDLSESNVKIQSMRSLDRLRTLLDERAGQR
jgi:hypothetical protein